MVIIITDQQRASGKTTLANEFLKDKDCLQLSGIAPMLGRFTPFKKAPDWVFIDGASKIDISIAQELDAKKFYNVHRPMKPSFERVKMPNFLLITNEVLQTK
jgi:hypothetical protein